MHREIGNILKVLAVVTPVLSGWGIKPPHPVLVYTSEKIDVVSSTLSNYHTKVFTSDDSTAEIMLTLTTYGVDPVLFHYDSSFKAETKMKKISNVLKAGQYKGKPIIRLPIVITDKILPDELLEEVVFFELDGYISSEKDILSLFESEDLALVRDKITEIGNEVSSDISFFRSGMCFLYPYFKNEGKIEEYYKLHAFVDNVVEMSDQARDSYGISVQFINALHEYMVQENLVLYLLPNVPVEVSDKTEKFMFYDENYLYISDALFKKIISCFNGIVGTNSLKAILVNDAILLKGNGKTYMSRMMFFDQYGRMHRPCFLRFDLKKLKRTGDIDFITNYGG